MWQRDTLSACQPKNLRGGGLTSGKPHTNGNPRLVRLTLFAFMLALATANVAAFTLATLVGSKDVNAAYPGHGLIVRCHW